MPTAPTGGDLPDASAEGENNSSGQDEIERWDENRVEPRLKECLQDEHSESEDETERDGVVGSEIGKSCDFVCRRYVAPEEVAEELAEGSFPKPGFERVQHNLAATEAVLLQANLLIFGSEGDALLELIVAEVLKVRSANH